MRFVSHWRVRLLPIAATAAMLAGAACSTVPNIRAEFDRQVDFSGYHTFGFFDVVGTDKAGYQTLVTQELKSATRDQLQARGYTYTESHPDLLVNFNTRLTDRFDVIRAPAPAWDYYDYRTYQTWHDYEVRVSWITEGTLNIDVVDAQRKQLVWEGIAQGPVTADVYRDRRAAIERAVERIFEKYPVPKRP